jgi:hypothetical protein
MKPIQLKTLTHRSEFWHTSNVYIIETNELIATAYASHRDTCIKNALEAAQVVLDERAEKQAKLEVVLEAILEGVFGKEVTQ